MKRVLIIALCIGITLVFFDSCKKKVKVEPKKVDTSEKVEEKTPKIEKPVLTEEEIFQRKSIQELNEAGHLNRIHFDFDKYFIKEGMKPILQKNADWLSKFNTVVLTLEGHCDERGTAEYNMALGEKRAKAVKDYLISLGIDESRLNTISYGKNKPLVDGHDEDSWYKNRRTEFVITKK